MLLLHLLDIRLRIQYTTITSSIIKTNTTPTSISSFPPGIPISVLMIYMFCFDLLKDKAFSN